MIYSDSRKVLPGLDAPTARPDHDRGRGIRRFSLLFGAGGDCTSHRRPLDSAAAYDCHGSYYVMSLVSFGGDKGVLVFYLAFEGIGLSVKALPYARVFFAGGFSCSCTVRVCWNC